jgi:hypothetical protein
VPVRSTLAPLLPLAVLTAGAAAQVPDPVPPPGDTVLVAPGAQYRAGPLYRAFMGSGYRDLWITPVRVPVADLDEYAGGLTPVRVGGGMTTRTLHLDGADGRRYVFRSVDKEPADLLEDFIGTPIEAILRDQVSSFNPSGALVVASLLEAVGVLHVTPRLVVVPDDPRLGEFREEFAGMLALYEERPDDPPPGSAAFAGAQEIVQADRLFEILEEDPRHRVASRELLRGRLVDLIVGDRDRSTNNHLWGRFADGTGGYLWRPIPRDRDQAFVRFDGFLKGLARNYETRLVTFGDEYSSIVGLTRNAWDIDRSFLNDISRTDWLETVQEVKDLLTDDVIDRAVRELPAGHYEVLTRDLTRALRARRDRLDEAAEEFYRVVFRYADVHASDSSETVAVERAADGSLHVRIESTGAGARTFERTFAPDQTREVRLYLYGGDDVVTVTGDARDLIRLRVIGGGGRDRFVDRSTTGPAANSFYDNGEATEVESGPGTRWYRRAVSRPFSWHEEERTLDWGHSWIPDPRFGYDADRGFVLSAGLTYNRYGFLRSPYSSQVGLRVGWSFGLQEPLLEYRHYFRDVVGGSDLRFEFRWSGMEILDFYGLGNESAPAGPTSFHRIPHKQIVMSTMIGFGDGESRQLSVGPVLQYLSTDTTGTSSYLRAVQPYGSGRFGQIGLRAAFELDGRDRQGTPSRGYALEGGATYFPEYMNVERGEFGEAHAQAAAYVSPPGGNPTLALRAQGKKLWGTYPFAESAFLGGATSLRGVHEQRYAGDASVLGSVELRVDVARILFIVPTDFGLIGLADIGRVFLDGEQSNEWHSGFGGGIWLAPLRRSSTVHFTVARAEQRTAIYFGVGLAF